MADNKDTSGGNLENACEGLADGALEIIGEVASGLPTPIKKNAIKAFGQLCTAAVDIPVAYLEGKAAEKRAETAGRVKIIESSANEIAKQIDVDPEYARIAADKYSQRIVREQANLDSIAHTAALELEASKPSSQDNVEQPDAPEISEDWLNAFEREASRKSSEEMRSLFGKILAGEIRQPSTFSIKTVRLVSQLDNQAAFLFQKLCSMSICLKAGPKLIDARVCSLGGNAGHNALKDYGLGFGSLSVLEEYGLIISDLNSYMQYDMCRVNEINRVDLPFYYLDAPFALKPINEDGKKSQIRINGVSLSNSGKELLPVIDKIEVPEYSSALKKWFGSQGLQVVSVTVT